MTIHTSGRNRGAVVDPIALSGGPLSPFVEASEQSFDETDAGTSIVAQRWLTFFDWVGQPTQWLRSPRIYAGVAGRRALRNFWGFDRAQARHLSFATPETFEALPGAFNAIILDWPHDVPPMEPATSIPQRNFRRAFLQCDVVLTGTPHTAAMLRKSGVGEIVIAPTPMAPAAMFGQSSPPTIATQTEGIVWTANETEESLSPRRINSFLAERRGPMFLARVDIESEPIALRILLAALQRAPNCRMLIVLENSAVFLQSPGETTLAAISNLGDRIGLIEGGPTGDPIASMLPKSSHYVSPTSGCPQQAGADIVWRMAAVMSGCSVIAPDCAALIDAPGVVDAALIPAEKIFVREGAETHPSNKRFPRRTWMIPPDRLAMAMERSLNAPATAPGSVRLDHLKEIASYEATFEKLRRFFGSSPLSSATRAKAVGA